ncbi:MAG: AAA family ATPase [Holosporaceae bacterium]|jgi:hypothetical protein|nr:AAA family ATPase [Holosporaceae bacterium]
MLLSKKLVRRKKIMISDKVNSVLGHEKEEAMLAKALVGGRVFPTWIFHGPWGIGKSKIAHKFAKCLLSETVPERDTLDIHPENPIHKLADLKIHPDFFVLEQNNESVSIDDSRKLMLKILKSPTLSKRRVVIMENASDLNKNIHNSLLKMLEEPPKNTVIIMICNHIGAVPRTLLSRAAKVQFCSLETSRVREILDDMGVKNSERLAQLSNGSVGYALHLHENNGAEIYENILKGFFYDGSLYVKISKYVIDNNLCRNFEIIKNSFLRILKTYADALNNVADENCQEEMKILEPTVKNKQNCIVGEIKKIQEIISMIELCEPMILDKNAVVANAFERFFS